MHILKTDGHTCCDLLLLVRNDLDFHHAPLNLWMAAVIIAIHRFFACQNKRGETQYAKDALTSSQSGGE